MSNGETHRIQELFLGALEIPKARRAAWLRKECHGNERLLQDVRSLLDHDTPAVDPLEQTLDHAITDFSPSALLAETSDDGNAEQETHDIELFLHRLTGTELLSREEVKAMVGLQSVDREAITPRQLAAQLVTAGTLTEFQAHALLTGEPELLIDKYLILDLIDSGGMGTIFKAVHRTMNRVVAVKMISRQTLGSSEQIQRFQREVRVAATLEHPNVVRSYDADQARGVHFLVMEYVRGENLHRAVQQQGPFSLDHAVDCVLQAARGMREAHSRGIIHRDIKPANLMRTEDGTIKVLDLGLAQFDDTTAIVTDVSGDADSEERAPHDSQRDDANLTIAGSVLGTASYMAPEQSAAPQLADARSDVYSLGCTFYFLLIGEPPYRAKSIDRTFALHRDSEIPSLRDKRPDVPESVEAVCQRMLAKDPADRYQSMLDLIEALEACGIAPPNTSSNTSDDQPPPAELFDSPQTSPTPKDGRVRRWTRPSTVLMMSLTVVALATVLLRHTADESFSDQHVTDTGSPAAGSDLDASLSAADLMATGDWMWQVDRNLGPSINSPSLDAGIDMSADRRTVVFASLRDGGLGGWDLWMCERPSENAAWSEATNLGPNVNSPGFDNSPALSADGLTLWFRRHHDGVRMMKSTRASLTDAWSVPEVWDSGIHFTSNFTLTSDERTLIFSRNAKTDDGKSHSDLYVARRSSPTKPWEEANPVESPVNTKSWESSATITDDGRLLVFTRMVSEEGKPTRYALFITTRSGWGAAWSEPIPFLPELDAVGGGRSPQLLSDGRTILFSSNDRDGEGFSDFWSARLVRKE